MDPMGTVADLSRATWRKSSYSSGNGSNCVEVARVFMWRKSSFSNGSGGACIEVGDAGRTIAVRDSKNPDGPCLLVSPGAWADFTNCVALGRLASVRHGD
jgi:hypothetical protein